MNFLFLFPDQHRADWLGGTPGLPLRTPHLDQLRRCGTHFNNAICPSPLCAPSRACLATGRDYAHCGVRNNREDLPPGTSTFYQQLREAGYHVAGSGKFDLHKASYVWGLDGRHGLNEWGFSDGIDNEGKIDAILSGRDAPCGPYMAFLESHGLRETHIADIEHRRRDKTATFPTPLPDFAYCDNWIGDNTLALMRRFPANKPWFLQVNFTGPHEPWDITATMATWYAGEKFPAPVNESAIPLAKHHAVRANYAAMIENIDRWIGRLLDEVRQRGEEDETLIVFASDHGEMLGDHGRWGKTMPFQPSLAVPLIVAGPGVQRDCIHQSPATILDLPATFLDFAGVEPLRGWESQSLRPKLEGNAAGSRQHVFAALNEWRAVYDGRYKLIEKFDGQSLLFDLREDPGETRNRIEDLFEHASRLHSLFQQPHDSHENPSRK